VLSSGAVRAGPDLRCVTRRRTPTQSFASLTEGSFHRKFAQLVELIGAVGPLPADTADGGVDALPADSAGGSDAGPE